jgi:hypothetical protein
MTEPTPSCSNCRYLYHNPTLAMQGRCSKREGIEPVVQEVYVLVDWMREMEGDGLTGHIQRANTRNTMTLVTNLAMSTDLQIAGFLKEDDLITGVVIKIIPPIKLSDIKGVSE